MPLEDDACSYELSVHKSAQNLKISGGVISSTVAYLVSCVCLRSFLQLVLIPIESMVIFIVMQSKLL